MKDVIAGNKLIAVFMGAKLNKGYPSIIYHVVNYEHVGYVDQLQYDTSWDWLMPVVEKIRRTDENQDNERDYELACQTLKIYNLTIWADIKVVWTEVIEFIKWYNQNKVV